MKELSIEQKAKRYDKAIEKAKSKIKNDKDHVLYEDDVIEIFPELKCSEPESADEKVRKALIKLVTNHASMDLFIEYDIHLDEALSWLEKQGKHKPADKVEPKFKVGDIIKPKDGGHEPWRIMQVDISDKKYRFNGGYVIHFLQEDDYELVEQKPTTWSEEDELHIRELESLVKQIWATAERGNDKETIHKMSDLSFFLKTLKPQLKQKWSEEDEESILEICNYLDRIVREDEDNQSTQLCVQELKEWLKSLRPQNHWKPSEEQMGALFEAHKQMSAVYHMPLITLYNDLKKLQQNRL